MRKKLHLRRNQSIGFISLLLLLLLFSCQQRYGYRKKVYIGKHTTEKEKHVEQKIKPADSTTIGLDDILLTETPIPSPAPEINKEEAENPEIKEDNKVIFPPQIKKHNTITQDSTQQKKPEQSKDSPSIFENETLLMMSIFLLLTLVVSLIVSLGLGLIFAAILFGIILGAGTSSAATLGLAALIIMIFGLAITIATYFIGHRIITRKYLPNISRWDSFLAYLLAIAAFVVLFYLGSLAGGIATTILLIALIVFAIIFLIKWRG